jgi:hypothetical protein
MGDPLMVVASIANPGGNITGLSACGDWRRFASLLTRYPLPAARIVHRYTTLSEALP